MKLSISKLAQNDSIEYSEFKKDKYLHPSSIKKITLTASGEFLFQANYTFSFFTESSLSSLERVLFPNVLEIGR